MSDAAKIDAFYAKDRQWKAEMLALRDILRATPLTEEMKWHQPIYTYDGGNVAMPAGFKHRCVLSFHKGVLLKDPEGVLIPPGDNSRVGRIIEFHSLDDIARLKDTITAYIDEAIELEKSGAKVDLPKDDLTPPDELTEALEADDALREAFDALTPGRRRSWILHIGGAKQAATRVARIEKARPAIFDGKGLNDR